MTNLRWSSLFLIVALLCAGTAAFAGFWDEGLKNGAVRTEYGPTGFDTDYGTASDPLQWDYCLYSNCQAIFPSANAYSDLGGSTASTYWVVIVNNEPWQVAGSNPGVGPPDASLPIGLPSASQVAGLKVYPGSQTVRLSLDHRYSNPHAAGQGAIPFLAFGTDKNRGNGGNAILPMNNNVNYVRGIYWQMKIEAANDGYCTSSATGHVTWAAVQAFAEWSGLKRAFYITLYSDGYTRSDTNGDGQVTCSDGTSQFFPAGSPPELVDFEGNGDGLWNWPIQRSLYYPGAEFYVLDATWLTNNCSGVNIPPHPGVGSTQSYFLDVEKVYRCLDSKGYWSDSMPYSVNLDGFWWVAELTGQNARMQYTVTNPLAINACVGCASP